MIPSISTCPLHNSYICIHSISWHTPYSSISMALCIQGTMKEHRCARIWSIPVRKQLQESGWESQAHINLHLRQQKSARLDCQILSDTVRYCQTGLLWHENYWIYWTFMVSLMIIGYIIGISVYHGNHGVWVLDVSAYCSIFNGLMQQSSTPCSSSPALSAALESLLRTMNPWGQGRWKTHQRRLDWNS